MVRIRSKNARRAELFGKKMTVTDKIILIRSDPQVHSEIQFSERYDNISFSFTTADGANCGRFKQIAYSHPERWDTVDVLTTNRQEDLMWDEAKDLEGVPYDLKGLLSTISKYDFIRPSDEAMWCSEGVCNVICAGRGDFLAFLKSIHKGYELIPSELDYLARHYFK